MSNNTTTVSNTVELPGVKISVHVEIINKAFERANEVVSRAHDLVEEVTSVIENELIVVTQDLKPSAALLDLLGLES
jgi:hypothetical protein